MQNIKSYFKQELNFLIFGGLWLVFLIFSYLEFDIMRKVRKTQKKNPYNSQIVLTRQFKLRCNPIFHQIYFQSTKINRVLVPIKEMTYRRGDRRNYHRIFHQAKTSAQSVGFLPQCDFKIISVYSVTVLAHGFVSHDQAEKDSQSFMLIFKKIYYN